VPSPVGPLSPDPNDPDLWDWDAGDDEGDPGLHPAWIVLAAVIFVVLAVGAFMAH